MRTAAGGKRRDASEAAIVQALRAVGASVWFLSGAGIPDLLIRYRGRLYAVECKTAKGKLTKHQSSDFPVARTPEQALAIIGVKLRMSGSYQGRGI